MLIVRIRKYKGAVYAGPCAAFDLRPGDAGALDLVSTRRQTSRSRNTPWKTSSAAGAQVPARCTGSTDPRKKDATVAGWTKLSPADAVEASTASMPQASR